MTHEIYKVVTISKTDSAYHIDPNCPTLSDRDNHELELQDADGITEADICGTCQQVFLL